MKKKMNLIVVIGLLSLFIGGLELFGAEIALLVKQKRDLTILYGAISQYDFNKAVSSSGSTFLYELKGNRVTLLQDDEGSLKKAVNVGLGLANIFDILLTGERLGNDKDGLAIEGFDKYYPVEGERFRQQFLNDLALDGATMLVSSRLDKASVEEYLNRVLKVRELLMGLLQKKINGVGD